MVPIQSLTYILNLWLELQLGKRDITPTVTSDHSGLAESTPTPSGACLAEVNSLGRSR